MRHATYRILISSLFAALLASLALSVGSGCKEIDKMIPETIDNPDKGSPEWVVQQAFIAAMEKDEPTGWKKFQSLLHSRERRSVLSEKSWRQMNFSAFRRKYPIYLEDKTKPVYELQYTEDFDDGAKKLFITNNRSDVPTPCQLEPDPQADGAWKIVRCSL